MNHKHDPPPNAQRQNHRLQPNVHLNTPRGLMAHLLNLWKPTTSKKERGRKQEVRILKPDNAKTRNAMRSNAASAESFQARDATEKDTKKPRHQDAHGEHALIRHTLASQGHLARPANWDSMSRNAKKNWKQIKANKRGRKHS